MASPSQIKEGLESLGGGTLDIKSLAKEAVKKNLESLFPDDLKRAEEVAEEVCKDASNYLYKSVQQKLIMLDNALQTIPSMATSLASQFATIPATVTGMAAPAAGPMVLGVKSQALALKNQLSQSLSVAVELGISLPIDPLLDAIKVISPLL